MKAFESAIRTAYADFNRQLASPVSSDDILCDPSLEDKFWEFAAESEPSLKTVGRPNGNRLLLRMRKRGSAKNGLPKIRK